LIEQILEAEVIHLHDELLGLEIWPPVVDRLDKPNELAFIGGELQMVRRHRTAEEGDWLVALVKNCANARPRCITVDNEGRLKSGNWSIGATISADLRDSNADATADVHWKASFFNSWVSGAAISP
jgi:hypothetical protein